MSTFSIGHQLSYRVHASSWSTIPRVNVQANKSSTLGPMVFRPGFPPRLPPPRCFDAPLDSSTSFVAILSFDAAGVRSTGECAAVQCHVVWLCDGAGTCLVVSPSPSFGSPKENLPTVRFHSIGYKGLRPPIPRPFPPPSEKKGVSSLLGWDQDRTEDWTSSTVGFPPERVVRRCDDRYKGRVDVAGACQGGGGRSKRPEVAPRKVECGCEEDCATPVDHGPQ